MIYITKFLSSFYKQKNTWLISERGHEARDNGYFFFLYLKKNHPELDVKYVISKDSQDRDKLIGYEKDLITFFSLKHFISVWTSKCLISTHAYGWAPSWSYYRDQDMKNKILGGKKIVFLQHGITHNDLPILYGDKNHFDLFVSGAQIEYEYLLKNFRYPEGIIQYTGFCRYDNLNNYKTKRQILIMPTWRKYIDKKHFKDSEYYKQYKNLLMSERLKVILDKYNMQLIFYPHYEIQSLIHYFKELELPKSVMIASFEYDVQTLLKESKLLITDYSSVFFDMAYMNKPLLFFQFDKKEFISKHYKKGYLNHSDMGVVSDNIEDLLLSLEKILANNCKVDTKYQEYIDKFFPLRDNHNCERIFNAITKISKS